VALRPTLSSGLPLSSNQRLKRTVTAETNSNKNASRIKNEVICYIGLI
jgi:hypothetical protein